MDIGVLIIRLVLGLTMASHGTQKLFGWFGGHGPAGTGRFLEQLGFVPGRRNALLAGLVETGGGLLLALGLVTPLAAALVFSVMGVAVFSVHLPKGFFNQNGGCEYNIVLGFSAVGVAFAGAGPVSLDAVLGLDLAGIYGGLSALGIGFLGTVILLASRRVPRPQGQG